MTLPLVSVLMTSYNREKYIAFAMESVLASTYTDFELIIVDDGSKDNTVAIARDYEKKDNRVRVYQNEKNLGDYPNRNKAASYARGKYIKYVDADDYIYPWGLKILVDSMEQFPDAGWGLCSLEPDVDMPFPFQLTPAEIYEYQNFKASLFHKSPLSVIINKVKFDEIGGFSGKRQMGDTEMWHLLALKYNLVLMPHGMVWYRNHDEQESVQIRRDIVVRVRYEISMLHFYESDAAIPISKEKRAIVRNRLKSRLRKYILINFFKGNFYSAYLIYKALSDHSWDFKKV